jgi:hypothetical protein
LRDYKGLSPAFSGLWVSVGAPNGVAARRFLLFSLFLQEKSSKGRAEPRRIPQLLVPSPTKEQRDEGSFLDRFGSRCQTGIMLLI